MILITGAAGYIGTELRRQLRSWGIPFIGVDNFVKPALDFRGALEDGVVIGDINDGDLMFDLILRNPVKAIVNLAAVVGDPACKKYPTQARKSNLEGVYNLLGVVENISKSIRFVQASTCSVYGFNPDEKLLTEKAPMNPLSLYADLKVQAEALVLGSPATTVLRFATAFGLSPKAMRYDLTVNEFTRDAFLGRTLRVYRKNDWRPYAHVWDLARVCMEAAWGNQLVGIFNVGSNRNNYTKQQLVSVLQGYRKFPVEWVEDSADQDQRNYRVDFQRLTNTRHAELAVDVISGMAEMLEHLEQEDPNGRQADSQECRSDFLNCPEG
jgi:nucleoside-diphosphate-sugar epimerase